MQTAFLGEGSEMDYKVSHLFADDFKYNRFNLSTAYTEDSYTRAETLKMATSRRRLHERVHNLNKLSPVWVTIIPGDLDNL